MNDDQCQPSPHLIYQETDSFQVCEDQCDCACITSPPSLGRNSAAFNDGPFSANISSVIPLARNYYVTSIERAPATIVLNQSALTVANYFADERSFTDIPASWEKSWGKATVVSTLAQMVKLGVLIPRNHTRLPPVEAPTSLSAWLHITERCNLRCAYCYLPHRLIDMPFETGQSAIDAIFRSAQTHDYKQIKLKYAGGEPMLCFPLVIRLHRYAHLLAKRHNLALDGVVLSNGVLLNADIAESMLRIGLRLMISLDGLGRFHNRQRYYANGHGSFADVERAVELALEHGLIPDISITVTARNAEGLPELVEWLLAHNLPFSLNFYRENDFSAAYEDLKGEEAQIIAGMLAAFKVIEANLPQRSVLASLIDRANLAVPHLRTCGVGHNYLVFDPNGRVAKCQMQINKPVTFASIDDPLTPIRSDGIGIQNISVEEKDGCRDCEWKHWCTGGCPLATYRATGRYDVKSPNCNIYKSLFPEAVRLEGLRLLKYTDQLNREILVAAP